jgi:hypothetical protein
MFFMTMQMLALMTVTTTSSHKFESFLGPKQASDLNIECK